VRSKVWRSNKDKQLHLLCAEGAEAFEALPVAIKNLGPWTGSKEGEVGHLRLALRSLLIDQGFVIVHAHVSKLNLENPIGTHGLHPANTECPDCRGTGQVDHIGVCIRSRAGDALVAGGSRRRSVDNGAAK
jgi:hypothetical protein